MLEGFLGKKGDMGPSVDDGNASGAKLVSKGVGALRGWSDRGDGHQVGLRPPAQDIACFHEDRFGLESLVFQDRRQKDSSKAGKLVAGIDVKVVRLRLDEGYLSDHVGGLLYL